MSRAATTRRSISVKGVSYIRAQRTANVLGISVSELVERGLRAIAEQVGVPEVGADELPRREPKQTNGNGEDDPDFKGSHFTF